MVPGNERVIGQAAPRDVVARGCASDSTECLAELPSALGAVNAEAENEEAVPAVLAKLARELEGHVRVVYRAGGSLQQVPHGATPGDLFWRGAATGSDGRIYACPHQHDEVLVIDPQVRQPLPSSALLSIWLDKL